MGAEEELQALQQLLYYIATCGMYLKVIFIVLVVFIFCFIVYKLFKSFFCNNFFI